MSPKNRWQQEQLKKHQAVAKQHGGPKIEAYIKELLARLNGPYTAVGMYNIPTIHRQIKALRTTMPNGPKKANMYKQQLNAVIKRRNAKKPAGTGTRAPVAGAPTQQRR
jgi:hypothetical protein